MKILMCHKFHFLSGGAERYLFDLRRGLSGLGHTVIDFSTQNAKNEHSDYSGYFVKGLNFSQISARRPLYNIKAAMNFIYSSEARKNIERLIDEFKPDIAHIHNIYHHLSVSILNIFRKRRIPVIMTLHDYKLICPNYSLFIEGMPCERCKHKNYFNAFIHKCLKSSYMASALACLEMHLYDIFKIYENNVDLFIAPSIFIKNKMVDFGIDSKKIYHLPYAIDLDCFSPDFEKGKYILYFGSLSYKKGIQTLLKSAVYLKNFPIKIIGDGPQKKEFEQAAYKERLMNVEFLGHKERDELAHFIRDALFVVVPSAWYEVSGLTIYESFASGKCVVGADTGGIPELVEDKHTGLLFRPGDPDDLAKKILYLSDNPRYIKEWGMNAYHKIHNLNNPRSHYQELLDIYDNRINKYN
jgi:glycosyltransferase involved in cell wall biosynthesis